MKVVYGINQLLKPLKASVAAIGVFDGVHKGHQLVLHRTVSEARRLGVASVAITFDPHPVKVLYPEKFFGYVLPLSRRLELIAEAGIDVCLVISFSYSFARMMPETFVKKVLSASLGVREIVVGDDFHFGHDREGSVPFLRRMGEMYGFKVDAKPLKKNNKNYIKSKYIRALVSRGEMTEASRLMGRPFMVSGVVIKGDGRGRLLGFPTANIQQENIIIPPSGIYLAHVFYRARKYNALFYIGKRPSFKKADAPISLEAYLLDFKGNLYGKRLDVRLIKKARNCIKFSDEKKLISSIQRDVLFARQYFSSHTS